MKIIQIQPKNFLSPTGNESSRLGMQVQGISLEQLSQIKHGMVIFGLPDEKGIQNVGGQLGAKEAPNEIRAKLYRFTSKKLSFPVYDLGNLEAQDTIEETHRRAYLILKQIRSAGHQPLVLGGGHDLVYPEAHSLLDETKKMTYGFLNIDAHLDVRNTNKGITSGSPWFLLLENPLFDKLKCKLIEFGIQNHCNTEELFSYAKKKKVEIYLYEKVASNAQRAFKTALKKLMVKSKILVSLDIDSIRSSDAPGCSAAQTLGFSAQEAVEMSFESGKNKKVCSFGIYEVSPKLDQHSRTSTLAAHCILSFLRGFELRK